MRRNEGRHRRRAAWGGIWGLAAATLTGCGTGDSDAGAAPAVENASTVELMAFGDQLFGDQTQRRAGELVAYHSFNDAIASCMRSRGSTHRAVAFPDLDEKWDADSVLSPISSWLTPPGTSTAVARTVADQARYAEAENAAPQGDDAYVDDSVACSTAGSEAQRDNVPQQAYELLEALNPVLEQLVSTETGVEYAACMSAAGFEGLEEPGDLTTVIMSRAPAGLDVSELTAQEAEGNAADLRCRGADYPGLVVDATARFADFQAEHGEEVIAVQEAWDDLVDEASTYPEWSS